MKDLRPHEFQGDVGALTTQEVLSAPLRNPLTLGLGEVLFDNAPQRDLVRTLIVFGRKATTQVTVTEFLPRHGPAAILDGVRFCRIGCRSG